MSYQRTQEDGGDTSNFKAQYVEGVGREHKRFEEICREHLRLFYRTHEVGGCTVQEDARGWRLYKRTQEVGVGEV